MQVISSLSKAGRIHQPNEDRCGFVGNTVWVIDGATGLANEDYVAADGDSDASWIAEQMNVFFKARAMDYGADFYRLFADGVTEIKATFERDAYHRPAHGYGWPTAALFMACVGPDFIHTAALADCVLLLKRGDKVETYHGDETHHGLDAETLREFVEHQKAGAQTIAEARALTLPSMIKQREKANLPGGHCVFAINTDFQDRIIARDIPAEGVTHGLLMSDGYYALVDKYSYYDEQSLFEAVLDKGLDAVYDELRAIEDADPEAHEYPRFKKSDDATAVLFTND